MSHICASVQIEVNIKIKKTTKIVLYICRGCRKLETKRVGSAHHVNDFSPNLEMCQIINKYYNAYMSGEPWNPHNVGLELSLTQPNEHYMSFVWQTHVGRYKDWAYCGWIRVQSAQQIFHNVYNRHEYIRVISSWLTRVMNDQLPEPIIKLILVYYWHYD